MPYIPLESHLPGITGLLEYRQDTAQPIRELTQILLRMCLYDYGKKNAPINRHENHGVKQ